MSLQDAINTGNPPALDWTNIRFKSLAIDGEIYDNNNNSGTAGQLLGKNSPNNELVWKTVNSNTVLGDINNFTSYQTSAGAATQINPGDTAQFMFSSFYDNTAAFSLLSWSIPPDNLTNFTQLGVYETVLDLNIVYPSGSNGIYTISFVSNEANLNGRVYSKPFSAPAAILGDVTDHQQISFIVDKRTAPTCDLQVFITNHASSTDPIYFNNTEPNCKITTIFLRSP